MASVDANGQSIERRHHAARQLRLEIRVEVVVREMREIRALGADLARGAHRLGNAEVRRMLGSKQGVDHEDAGAAKQRRAPPAAATWRR